jgi:hypothetical protein
LDFFPDELVIQEQTVSIIRREFMLTYVETMPVREIEKVAYTEAGFFASLTISAKVPGTTLEIASVPKDHARRAKEILDALIVNGKK